MEIPFDIKRVQNRLLEMAKAIAAILEKNNIPYEIAFGTLLGAVRHGGFIPWDDDFDFFLFEDSYDKAMEALARELPAGMFLENEKTEPKYFHGWAHVKDLHSKCDCQQFPQDSLYSHHGISVDLYKAKELRECDLQSYLTSEHIAYLERKLKHGFMQQGDFDKKVSELREAEKNAVATDSSKKIFALNLPERQMSFEATFPLKKYNFENCSFYGPNDADCILKGFFGNYMELPAEEHRHPHYSSVIFED